MLRALGVTLVLGFASITHAAYENWTNKDGKTASLELISVTSVDGENVGKFRMRNGRTVDLAASSLAEAEAARLTAFMEKAEKAPADASTTGADSESVFDSVLDGNLVKLNGKSLKKVTDFKKPTKYYLFYYTASWCVPCQKFSPSLVKFYNDNKNDEFEIILITSDSDEDAMEGYAAEKEMEWPHLRLKKVEDFKKKFAHPGGGIPNLVLTDLEGNLLKTSYDGDTYLGPAVPMNHLGTLLAK